MESENSSAVTAFEGHTPFALAEPVRANNDLGLVRQLMLHTREGIVLMDARGRVLEVNPAFCCHCELDADSLKGRHLTHVSQGRYQGRFYRRIWQRLQFRGHWEGEVEHLTGQGEVATHWLMLRLIRDEAGLISHIIGILDNISRLRQSEERLSYLAHHDSLTGAANRAFLLSWFARIKCDLHPDEQLALLFIDLDRFKPINDGFGHGVGDQVLKTLAGRLRQQVDANEMVARIGGDEFVLVWRMSGGEEQPLLERAARLLENMEAPVSAGHHQLSVGASVGISLYPRHGLEIETLLRYADTAMYEAKTRSQARISLFDSASFARLELRSRLAREFHEALARRQLFLEYQPRLDVESGRIVGAEALLRWRHPVLGLVPPDDFLPAARNAGLLGRLAEWVFGEAARQSQDWRRQGWQGRISLNMRGLEPELEQQRILRLLDILREHGAEPADFELELRSDFIMRRSDSLLRVLSAFRQAGMGVYLDNLGDGRLNLRLLQQLPVDGIKLDRRLFAEAFEDYERAVIRALLLLAGTLGLEAVACGVENREQLAFLQEHGCHLIQGRLVAPPLAPAQVPAFMAGCPAPAGSAGRD
ncbi:putative bifunctional diguanylate cyclase/phosphodiesterase [Oceanimonas doudoroffii]|uniref:PAS domain S-box protein n=1 Tax=Oceanimonas doudoroffii TaxID=84158 RepID=A0A233REI5_9GAMM|nr:EAL domain-containing protein [Oceanimonas doudoroffii]OXY81804.1 PAS domain S-box protein [Oceanimonas doudoroffii]